MNRKAAAWGRIGGTILVAASAALCLFGRPHQPRDRGAVAAEATEKEPAPTWGRPRFAEREAERREMVRDQIERRGITAPPVLDALRNVPRHEFVPKDLQGRAYDDTPLPIGRGQTISQPYIVAYMTDALRVRAGDKVLEVGTGSGYQAAVLSEITPNVFTIEIVKELGEQARERLARLGYKTIGCRIGDGYLGWPEHAPFDAIIVTCAPDQIPPPLIEQLKPGGRICIPVGAGRFSQELVLATKDAKGEIARRTLIPVVFVPLTREPKKEAPL